MDNKMCCNPLCVSKTLIENELGSAEGKSTERDLIVDPYISKEPSLVKGFTTVFSVTGNNFKPDPANKGSKYSCERRVYKIIPNTHIHVTNTVIIDTERDILRKLENKDPSTMKKLLDSQKMSAKKRLKTYIETAIRNISENLVTDSKVTENITNSSGTNSKQNDEIFRAFTSPPPLRMLMPVTKKKKDSIVNPVTIINKEILATFLQNEKLNKQDLVRKTTQPILTNTTEPILKSTVHPNLKITSVTSINEKLSSPLQKVPTLSIKPPQVSIPLAIPVAVNEPPVIIKQQPVLSEQEKSELQIVREELAEMRELLKNINGKIRQQ